MTWRPAGLPIFLLVATLLPPTTVAVAQVPTANPHGKLQEECSTCHAPAGWKPARISRGFDHSKKGFALTGAHAQTPCRSCHASLDFSRADQTCVSCHSDVHQGELGPDCSQCHTPRSFLDRSAMARAHRLTRFPLTGSHVTVECESCHTPSAQGRLTFVKRSSDCVQCHSDAFRNAKNPDHVGGGFPQDCSQCHSTATWPRARFNHTATRFPLTGAHRAVPCAQCHGDGVYHGKNVACVACHQADYDRTTDPNHGAARFPSDCAACHTTTTWTGARFDHAGTSFPLTGAHLVIPCQSCHGDGVYAGKPSACIACHQANYDQTTDPNHQAAGFSTDCTGCHTTTRWEGATFDHDARFFPINSGAHRGRWPSCSTCHVNPASFQQFSCLACHEHSQSLMDSHHGSVSGYSYDSQACFSCHPRGTH